MEPPKGASRSSNAKETEAFGLFPPEVEFFSGKTHPVIFHLQLQTVLIPPHRNFDMMSLRMLYHISQ